MVYTRMVYSYHNGARYGPYGPYRYKSVREGPNPHVRSIYLGPGEHITPSFEKPLSSFESKEPEIKSDLKPYKKIRKTIIRHELTGIEIFHLKNKCDSYELDYQEIDNNLSYNENKRHLENLAQEKGVSREEISGEEKQYQEWEGEYERYKEYLKESEMSNMQ